MLETCCEVAYDAVLAECSSYVASPQELVEHSEELRRAAKEVDAQISICEQELADIQGLPPLFAFAERAKAATLRERIWALTQERTALRSELKAPRKEIRGTQARTRRSWRDVFLRAGLDIRQIIMEPHSLAPWMIDWGLSVRPVEQKQAKEFIRRHHRHNPPPAGWLFGLGCYNGPDLVAVAWVGRPVSRILDRTGERIEVNRLCVNPELDSGLTWNACSLLYAECAKQAKSTLNKAGRHYRVIQTYTLESELGTSLRAAGWEPVHKNNGGTWNRASRPRTSSLPTESKIRWEKVLC